MRDIGKAESFWHVLDFDYTEMVSRGKPQSETFGVGVKRQLTPINVRPSDENRSSRVRNRVHACDKRKIPS